MNEAQWNHYLHLLAQTERTPTATRRCVGCWYEEHPDGDPFPGDRVSSTLCSRHVAACWATVKPQIKAIPVAAGTGGTRTL